MTEDNSIFDLLEDYDDVTEGAAIQSATEVSDLDGIPRVLRYAILGASGRVGTARQLAAEIIDLAPEAAEPARAWLARPTLDRTTQLAGNLDRLSVETDRPTLRSLADSVRIVALPIPTLDRRCGSDYMRVARVLSLARDLIGDVTDELRAKADHAILSWAVAPIQADPDTRQLAGPAIIAGAHVVDDLNERIIKCAISKAIGAEVVVVEPQASSFTTIDEGFDQRGHVVVCRRAIEGSITSRANDVIRPHVEIINAPVPLVACPDLHPIHKALAREFPYAIDVIDFVLAGLAGRPYVAFEPLLLVGEPGGGKTRFVRRLCELLSLGLWRVDGAQADGSACAGTDKRWSTASPSAPLLAISRFKQANPVLLFDEIDKAATRTDFGRLWDVMVSLCERENTRRYPDPGLGVEIDISHVSYIATANGTMMLPGPLLDRFRQIEFPCPQPHDMDALLEILRQEIARERGVDVRFYPPLSPEERRLVRKQWAGGSVRRLRRLLEVVLRARDRLAVGQ